MGLLHSLGGLAQEHILTVLDCLIGNTTMPQSSSAKDVKNALFRSAPLKALSALEPLLSGLGMCEPLVARCVFS